MHVRCFSLFLFFFFPLLRANRIRCENTIWKKLEKILFFLCWIKIILICRCLVFDSFCLAVREIIDVWKLIFGRSICDIIIVETGSSNKRIKLKDRVVIHDFRWSETNELEIELVTLCLRLRLANFQNLHPKVAKHLPLVVRLVFFTQVLINIAELSVQEESYVIVIYTEWKIAKSRGSRVIRE